jgi:hypothetical protein
MSVNLVAEKAILFKPQQALRLRWNMNTDTPMPTREPGGQNPQERSRFDYYLSESSSNEVSLEILMLQENLFANTVIKTHCIKYLI